MNILDFYKQNITENEYYYKFYDEIITTPEKEKKELMSFWGTNDDSSFDNSNDYIFFDEEDVIEKFKFLCQPDTETSKENTMMFHLVCYYLYKMRYVLEEFPRVLERPPENPYDFTNKEIRNRVISQGKMRANGQVPYSERRIIVSNFTFSKKRASMVDDNLESIFERISTRSAKFENMAVDEKLKEIANAMEYMLKENKKYISIDYEVITTGIIDEQKVIDFRKKIQCFRHSSEESIKERNSFSNSQKEFLIDYGVTICRLIYYNKFI